MDGPVSPPPDPRAALDPDAAPAPGTPPGAPPDPGRSPPDPRTAFDFSGRVVVVTGGGRGVGRAVARAFLAAGAEVVVCGRHQPGSLPRVAVAHTHSPTHRTAVFVPADVREPDQARAVIQTAVERFGRLDVLVNNAGGSPEAEAATASPRFIASVVALNLLAPFYCAQSANEVLQAGAGGSIVNVGSVSGLRPSPGTAAYGAAKAGLVNLTQTLAVEWAPKVRVNCVTAGLLDTDTDTDTGAGAGAGADPGPRPGPEHYGGAEGMARVAATVPLGRMGTPEDVAGLCLFLASPLAAYVTGANLVAHGGGEWPAYQRAARGG